MASSVSSDPKTKYPQPPFDEKRQDPPGTEGEFTTQADQGEESYRGNGRLAGKAAIITGADSGIGRAVAIAFAREGADVLISYLNEEEDAQETARWVKKARRQAILVPGDISQESHCQSIIRQAVKEFERIDILVNNAAFQKTYEDVTEIPSEEWDHTFRTNIYAMFYLVKAAVEHMPKGASIINTASINSDSPSPGLLAYATTKGAISNFTAGLAQSLAKRGIRAKLHFGRDDSGHRGQTHPLNLCHAIPYSLWPTGAGSRPTGSETRVGAAKLPPWWMKSN